MIGLYFHIPFCARRCPYCDFAVHIGDSLHHKYLPALQSELRHTLSAHFERFPQDSIGTIFCGGGTPTSVGAHELNTLLHTIREHAPVDVRAEITLEGNPEDASPEMFDKLRGAGWNRLSLGVQSLDDGVLQVLGRRHTRAQVEGAVEMARASGFENLNLDLIYAVPGQSLESWRESLHRALELKVPHLSCYSLTIEPGTAFGRRVEKKRMAEVPDDTQAEFMDEAQQVLGAGGLDRYEVSNYARAGFECEHNLRTWRGGDYLACGNGAHGHLSGHRWWNGRAVPPYIEAIAGGRWAREGEEFLSARQRLDELVLMGLRLREGVDLEAAERISGCDVKREIGARVARALERGDLERGTLEEVGQGEYCKVVWTSSRGPRVRLGEGRWALADAVALDVLS